MSQHNGTSIRGQGEGTPLYVRLWWNGQQIVSGVLGHDKIFRRRFDYLLEKPPALPLDARNVEQLAAQGCKALELKHRPTGITYSIDFAQFRSLAVETNRGRAGRQYYVPLEHWKASAPPANSRPAPMPAQQTTAPQRPVSVQLGLF
jgi:hypothetical protein